LEELNQLKQLVPKESSVFFLIGNVHSKLGNTHLALMHFSWAMDLDPKGANSQIKDALDPTLNRAGQEDASSSVAPSATVPPSSTSIIAAASMDDSPLVNATQPAVIHAEGGNLDQSALVTDEAGPSGMQQPSLDIDVSGDVAIARSRGINNLVESEDNEDVTVPSNNRNVASDRVDNEFVDGRVQDDNILNVAIEEEISSPDDIRRESGNPRMRRGDLRSHRQHPRQVAIDITIGDDRTETQATNDFIMEDLPPLRTTSTSSLQYYQQRDEDVLLAPELMTPSPTPITPPNIRTSTTATSPTRPFELPSQSFHQFNQEEEVVPDNAPPLEASNNRQVIMNDQANLNISHDDTSNHPMDQRPSHIHGGRAMGSDESL